MRQCYYDVQCAVQDLVRFKHQTPVVCCNTCVGHIWDKSLTLKR